MKNKEGEGGPSQKFGGTTSSGWSGVTRLIGGSGEEVIGQNANKMNGKKGMNHLWKKRRDEMREGRRSR